MKIVVIIIPIDLVTNIFLTNQKQESGFQQDGGLVMRKISVFLFIATQALLQSHVEFNKFL